MKSHINIEKVPVIAATVMLLLAIPPIFPYGYYVLMRIIVCGTSVYVAIKAKEAQQNAWMWGMGFLAVLFNPLIPIHFGKGVWVVIDLTVAAIYLFLLSKIKNK